MCPYMDRENAFRVYSEGLVLFTVSASWIFTGGYIKKKLLRRCFLFVELEGPGIVSIEDQVLGPLIQVLV